ncbi:hypothetical protein [Croceicoccus sp. Ery15]|uniref:hypothetical protein n=1 Tax=Croceicoccus sp. Ery15 TaxID=1703338 RepID=UPI001E35EF37|nr:hypothetical protein [Croceicoccus sp. Ery15]
MFSFSRFFRLFNPVAAVRDFRDVWVQENPVRLRVLLLSGAATFAIFGTMFGESHMIQPRPPEVTYITSYQGDRTDAEIIAENIANQQEKNERFAEADARRAAARQAYETVGNATGVDTSEARAEGEAERRQYERDLAEARAKALARWGTIDPATGQIVSPKEQQAPVDTAE